MIEFKFISYYPLKQGLKLNTGQWEIQYAKQIYILLSIKTRIETHNNGGGIQ